MAVIIDDIETQWQKWQDENPIDKIQYIDTDKLKNIVVKDLTFVSVMNVKEYTLYQKWCEVHYKRIIYLMTGQL